MSIHSCDIITKSLLHRIETALEGSLRDLLLELRRTGEKKKDVKGIADSLIAIHECLPDERFPGFRSYASDLILVEKETNNSEHVYWQEEVWHTSMATIALSGESAHRKWVKKAIQWLSGQFKETSLNWDEEPWETFWALLAIHAAFTKAEVPLPDVDFEKPLRWLLSLRGKPRPELLISWHYTALFCLVAQRYSSPLLQSVVSDELQSSLKKAYIESTRCIALELASLTNMQDKNELWTKRIWCNSLITWALAESDEICSDLRGHLPGLEHLVDWFLKKLRENNVFTEDRAFACIALNHLVVSVERADELAFAQTLNSLPKNKTQRKVVDIANQCGSVIRRTKKTKLQERLSDRLRNFRDYTHRTPLLTKNVFHGYYSLNLRVLPTNIFLIISATILLTVAAQNAPAIFGEKVSRIVAWIPLFLGALATIMQLMDINLANLFSRRKPPAEDRND
jgi:hypothetical protein